MARPALRLEERRDILECDAAFACRRSGLFGGRAACCAGVDPVNHRLQRLVAELGEVLAALHLHEQARLRVVRNNDRAVRAAGHHAFVSRQHQPAGRRLVVVARPTFRLEERRDRVKRQFAPRRRLSLRLRLAYRRGGPVGGQNFGETGRVQASVFPGRAVTRRV